MCSVPKVLWNLEWIFPQELEIGMRIPVAVHKSWFNSQYSSTIDNYRGHIFWTQYWDPWFDKYTCSPTNRRIAYWNWVGAGRARMHCTAVLWCCTVDPNTGITASIGKCMSCFNSGHQDHIPPAADAPKCLPTGLRSQDVAHHCFDDWPAPGSRILCSLSWFHSLFSYKPRPIPGCGNNPNP